MATTLMKDSSVPSKKSRAAATDGPVCKTVRFRNGTTPIWKGKWSIHGLFRSHLVQKRKPSCHAGVRTSTYNEDKRSALPYIGKRRRGTEKHTRVHARPGTTNEAHSTNGRCRATQRSDLDRPGHIIAFSVSSQALLSVRPRTLAPVGFSCMFLSCSYVPAAWLLRPSRTALGVIVWPIRRVRINLGPRHQGASIAVWKTATFRLLQSG